MSRIIALTGLDEPVGEVIEQLRISTGGPVCRRLLFALFSAFLAYSPAGTTDAAGTASAIQVWQRETGAELLCQRVDNRMVRLPTSSAISKSGVVQHWEMGPAGIEEEYRCSPVVEGIDDTRSVHQETRFLRETGLLMSQSDMFDPLPYFPKRCPIAIELGPWPVRMTNWLRLSIIPSTSNTAIRWA
jgi:hypothetical protein